MKTEYIKNNMSGCTFTKNEVNIKLPEKLNNKDISICLVEAQKGKNNYCMLEKSTIFYFVISGNGKFIISNKECDVKENDLIEILPQNKYTYLGNLKMLEIQTPAFNENEVFEFDN